MKFQTQDLLEVPKFKTALEYRDTFTFGIDKLDSKLQLHLDDMIGIFGETRYTNALATRLVVRSLLPRNHGGVDAENVIVIPALSTIEIRAKKEFDETKLNFSIYNKGRLRKVSMTDAELRID